MPYHLATRPSDRSVAHASGVRRCHGAGGAADNDPRDRESYRAAGVQPRPETLPAQRPSGPRCSPCRPRGPRTPRPIAATRPAGVPTFQEGQARTRRGGARRSCHLAGTLSASREDGPAERLTEQHGPAEHAHDLGQARQRPCPPRIDPPEPPEARDVRGDALVGPQPWGARPGRRRGRRRHIRSIIAVANSLVRTFVAPSIWRAKS